MHNNVQGLNQQQEDLIEQHRHEAMVNSYRDQNKTSSVNIPEKGSRKSIVQQAFAKSKETFVGAAPGKARLIGNGDGQSVVESRRNRREDAQQALEPGAAADDNHQHSGVNRKFGAPEKNNKDLDKGGSESHFDNSRNIGVHYRGPTRGTKVAEEGLHRSDNWNDRNGRQDPVLPKENNVLGIPIEQQPKPVAMGNNNPYEGVNNVQGGGGFYQGNRDSVNNAGSYNEQQQYHQPEPSLVGGMNLAWDWEDFSISFNNYGAAEMKVRRSPHPTTGEPWPMPQYYSTKDNKVCRIRKFNI